jgi:hypothetical protein
MSESLGDRVRTADSGVTALDDKVTVENKAIYAWLKGHELHHGFYNHLVIGADPLPSAWAEKTLPFRTRSDSDQFVKRFARDPTALHSLKALLSKTGELPAYGPVTNAVLLDATSTALLYGHLWAMSPKPMANLKVGKTTASVFTPLNAQLGTKIDFAVIARFEGDQWLRGYVPMSKGVVLGASGMTIATGFDIGQWSVGQIAALGFSPDLVARLSPFCQPNNFKGMTKAEVLQALAKLGPVPEITKTEADQIDGVVFAAILRSAIANWDRLRSPGTPAFRDMPAGWQTVWLSRNYQEGGAPHAASARNFRKAALEGRWQDAINALRGYTEYKARTAEEATILGRELPPPPPNRAPQPPKPVAPSPSAAPEGPLLKPLA